MKQYVTQKKLDDMAFRLDVAVDECERSSNPDCKQVWLLKRTLKEATEGWYEGC